MNAWDVAQNLTAGEVAALCEVENGADVYDYRTAYYLRRIECVAPNLFSIGPVMNRPPDHCRQPYFTAKATNAGRKVIAQLRTITE